MFGQDRIVHIKGNKIEQIKYEVIVTYQKSPYQR